MTKRKSAEHSEPKDKDKVKQKLCNDDDDKLIDNSAAVPTYGEGLSNASTPQPRGWTPISTLQNFHKTWTLKVIVLRRSDTDHWENACGSGRLLKIIVMDPEGTSISLVLFNNEIDRWQTMLTRGHTYYISNGFVKAYDTRFRSTHPSLEITLNNQTIIEEAEDNLVFDPIGCRPVEFEHVTKQPNTFEIVGTLAGVHPLATYTSRKKNTLVPKRLITIRNYRAYRRQPSPSHQIIWPSDADVTVLLTNLLVSQYQGNVSFSTTAASVVLHSINPKNARTLRQFVPEDELPTVEEKTPNARWPNSVEVKIPDLLREIKDDMKRTECRLKVQIIGFENIDAPWYNSCSKCKKGFFASNGQLPCPKCKSTEHEFRYSLRITVSDDTSQLTVTLFDAAEAFTGYPIKEYRSMPTEKTKALLAERIGKNYSFYFNMARITSNDQTRGRIVAEAFEKDTTV